MKTSVVRESRPSASLSPKGKVRKSSQERKEKIKLESTLRQLVGSDESCSQLDMVLSAIAYIRELELRLQSSDEESDNDENVVPEQLLDMLTKCTAQ